MKRFLTTAMLVLVLGLAGCTDDAHEVTLDETVVQDAAWINANCNTMLCSVDHQDCSDFYLCVHKERLTEVCGHTVNQCVPDACQVEPFDTCPAGFYCADDSKCAESDPTLPNCLTDENCLDGEVCDDGVCVTATECESYVDCGRGMVCDDGTCVRPTVEPYFVNLTACYPVADLPTTTDLAWMEANGFDVTTATPPSGQTSWVANSKPWDYSPNAVFDEDGCFSAQVDLRDVLEGFWIDVTVGKIPCDEDGVCDHTDPSVLWWGDRAVPTVFYIDGVEVDLNTEHSWGYGYGCDFLSDGPGGEVPDYVFEEEVTESETEADPTDG